MSSTEMFCTFLPWCWWVFHEEWCHLMPCHQYHSTNTYHNNRLKTVSLSRGGCPGCPRGFYFWQSQPLDRVTPPWLLNLRLPAKSPYANGTRYLSHWFISGKIKGWGRENTIKETSHALFLGLRALFTFLLLTYFSLHHLAFKMNWIIL